MKIHFDDRAWSQLEEYLRVGRVCGETSNELHSVTKGVAQRVIASLDTERDVPEAEAEHTLAILLTFRDATIDAARAFASAVDRIDILIGQVEPAAGPSARRSRRPRPKPPRS